MYFERILMQHFYSFYIFFLIPTDIKKQFSIPPQSVRVEAGGRSEIRCGAPSGVPQPTLQWLKNGLHLVPDSSVLMTAEGNILISHASLQVRYFQFSVFCLDFFPFFVLCSFKRVFNRWWHEEWRFLYHLKKVFEFFFSVSVLKLLSESCMSTKKKNV